MVTVFELLLEKYLDLNSYGQWINAGSMKVLNIDENDINGHEGVMKHYYLKKTGSIPARVYRYAFNDGWVRFVFVYDIIGIEGKLVNVKKVVKRIFSELAKSRKEIRIDIIGDSNEAASSIVDSSVGLPEIRKLIAEQEMVEDKIHLKSISISINPRDFLELKGMTKDGLITIKRWASSDEYNRAEAENLKRQIIAGSNTKYIVILPKKTI